MRLKKACCIPLCMARPGGSLSFHPFPSDENMREEWISVIKEKFPNFSYNEDAKVCSLHFSDADFSKEERGKLVPGARLGSIPLQVFVLGKSDQVDLSSNEVKTGKRNVDSSIKNDSAPNKLSVPPLLSQTKSNEPFISKKLSVPHLFEDTHYSPERQFSSVRAPSIARKTGPPFEREINKPEVHYKLQMQNGKLSLVSKKNKNSPDGSSPLAKTRHVVIKKTPNLTSLRDLPLCALGSKSGVILRLQKTGDRMDTSRNNFITYIPSTAGSRGSPSNTKVPRTHSIMCVAPNKNSPAKEIEKRKTPHLLSKCVAVASNPCRDAINRPSVHLDPGNDKFTSLIPDCPKVLRTYSKKNCLTGEAETRKEPLLPGDSVAPAASNSSCEAINEPPVLLNPGKDNPNTLSPTTECPFNDKIPGLEGATSVMNVGSDKNFINTELEERKNPSLPADSVVSASSFPGEETTNGPSVCMDPGKDNSITLIPPADFPSNDKVPGLEGATSVMNVGTEKNSHTTELEKRKNPSLPAINVASATSNACHEAIDVDPGKNKSTALITSTKCPPNPKVPQLDGATTDMNVGTKENSLPKEIQPKKIPGLLVESVKWKEALSGVSVATKKDSLHKKKRKLIPANSVASAASNPCREAIDGRTGQLDPGKNKSSTLISSTECPPNAKIPRLEGATSSMSVSTKRGDLTKERKKEKKKKKTHLPGGIVASAASNPCLDSKDGPTAHLDPGKIKSTSLIPLKECLPNAKVPQLAGATSGVGVGAKNDCLTKDLKKKKKNKSQLPADIVASAASNPHLEAIDGRTTHLDPHKNKSTRPISSTECPPKAKVPRLKGETSGVSIGTKTSCPPEELKKKNKNPRLLVENETSAASKPCREPSGEPASLHLLLKGLDELNAFNEESISSSGLKNNGKILNLKEEQSERPVHPGLKSLKYLSRRKNLMLKRKDSLLINTEGNKIDSLEKKKADRILSKHREYAVKFLGQFLTKDGVGEKPAENNFTIPLTIDKVYDNSQLEVLCQTLIGALQKLHDSEMEDVNLRLAISITDNLKNLGDNDNAGGKNTSSGIFKNPLYTVKVDKNTPEDIKKVQKNSKKSQLERAIEKERVKFEEEISKLQAELLAKSTVIAEKNDRIEYLMNILSKGKGLNQGYPHETNVTESNLDLIEVCSEEVIYDDAFMSDNFERKFSEIYEQVTNNSCQKIGFG